MTSDVPWRLVAAVALFAAARVRSRPGIPRADLGRLVVLGAVALALRLVLGAWGPFRMNGLAAMWLSAAVWEPRLLHAYGPGYPEVFSAVARLARSSPDVAIFAANAVLSSLVAPLAFALGRLAGLDRARALLPAALLAIDPVALRVAATESYTSSVALLTLLGTVGWLGAGHHALRWDWPRAGLLALAAALVLAQGARIHAVALIPAALAPVSVAAVAGNVPARTRVAFAAAAVATTVGLVAATGAGAVLHQLSVVREQPPVAPSATAILTWTVCGSAALVLVLVRGGPRWIALPAALQIAALAATRPTFGQGWLWQQSFDRLYVALPLVALATIARDAWLGRRDVRWGLLGAAAVLLATSWS